MITGEFKSIAGLRQQFGSPVSEDAGAENLGAETRTVSETFYANKL
jgi:hypothetical protein